MKDIFIQEVNTYDSLLLDEAIEKGIDLLHGKDFSFDGEEVFLKPNLLMESTPEKAELTHPEVIKAVCRAVMKRKGRPIVCDSPAFGALTKILESLGLKSWLDEEGIEARELKKTITLKQKNPLTGGPLIISKDLAEAPYVINMPKLKAHVQMKMTGAVKNMFGAVVGKRKAFLHMLSRNDVFAFSHMVLRVCYAVNPMLTIVDAVESLSERGPRRGKPLATRLIVAGRDPVEIDCFLAALMEKDPEIIFTNHVARIKEIGRFQAAAHWGGLLEAFTLKPFQLPLEEEMTPIAFKPLRVLMSMIKHLFAKWKR